MCAGVKGDQEKVLDPLELDLDGSLGAWYGYGNRTWVLLQALLTSPYSLSACVTLIMSKLGLLKD